METRNTIHPEHAKRMTTDELRDEAVISPSWSIHGGAGTASCSFIWGMAGENKDFGDLDVIPLMDMK